MISRVNHWCRICPQLQVIYRREVAQQVPVVPVGRLDNFPMRYYSQSLKASDFTNLEAVGSTRDFPRELLQPRRGDLDDHALAALAPRINAQDAQLWGVQLEAPELVVDVHLQSLERGGSEHQRVVHNFVEISKILFVSSPSERNMFRSNKNSLTFEFGPAQITHLASPKTCLNLLCPRLLECLIPIPPFTSSSLSSPGGGGGATSGAGLCGFEHPISETPAGRSSPFTSSPLSSPWRRRRNLQAHVHIALLVNWGN